MIKLTANGLMNILKSAFDGQSVNALMTYAESYNGIISGKISLGEPEVSNNGTIILNDDNADKTGIINPSIDANLVTQVDNNTLDERHYENLYKMIYRQTKGILHNATMNSIISYSKAHNIVPTEDSFLATYVFLINEKLSAAPVLSESIAQSIMGNNLRDKKDTHNIISKDDIDNIFKANQ